MSHVLIIMLVYLNTVTVEHVPVEGYELCEDVRVQVMEMHAELKTAAKVVAECMRVK